MFTTYVRSDIFEVSVSKGCDGSISGHHGCQRDCGIGAQIPISVYDFYLNKRQILHTRFHRLILNPQSDGCRISSRLQTTTFHCLSVLDAFCPKRACKIVQCKGCLHLCVAPYLFLSDELVIEIKSHKRITRVDLHLYGLSFMAGPRPALPSRPYGPKSQMDLARISVGSFTAI